MFLTKIELDPNRRMTRKFLGSPQVMHAVIMKATAEAHDNGPGRVLWRVDRSASGTTLFVLSPQQPDCTQIVAEAGAAETQARTLDYEPFLSRLEAGQSWAFRLTANPSRSVSRGPGQRGQRYGHVTVEQQRQWLIDRVDRLGFELVRHPENLSEGPGSSLVVVRRSRPVFGRDNPQGHRRDRVTINQTVFEGILRVTDSEALRNSLTRGIGRSKAYGCGLMTLAKVQRD